MSKSKDQCPVCGSEDHYVVFQEQVNRYSILVKMLLAVICVQCGHLIEGDAYTGLYRTGDTSVQGPLKEGTITPDTIQRVQRQFGKKKETA